MSTSIITNSRDITSVSAMEKAFAIPHENIGDGWRAGWGFDPVSGYTVNRNGIDPKSIKIETDYNVQTAPYNYSEVKSSGDISAALSASETASIGAFGCKAKETMKVQTVGSASASSIVMQYKQIGSLRRTGFQDLDKATLTDKARDMIVNKGFDEFCKNENYGTCFIQSITYGMGIYMNYTMKFKSVSAQIAYTEQMKEKAPGEKASENIDSALETSGTKYQKDVGVAPYGYTPVPVFLNIDDMDLVVNDFNAEFEKSKEESKGDEEIGVPVTAWVVHWAALPAVQEILDAQAMSLEDNYNAMLSNYMKLNYISTSAQSLVDENGFAGGSQFKALSSLYETSSDELVNLKNTLDGASASGTSIEDETRKTWDATVSKLSDALKKESQRITVNWGAYLLGTAGGSNVVATALIENTDGKLPTTTYSLSGHSELSGSCYLHWPQSTHPTETFTVCEWTDGGAVKGKVVVKLDRNTQTIQVYYHNLETDHEAVYPGNPIVVAGLKDTSSANNTLALQKSKAADAELSYLYGEATVG